MSTETTIKSTHESDISIASTGWLRTQWRTVVGVIVATFLLGGYVIRNENVLASVANNQVKTEYNFAIVKKLMIAQMEIQIKLARRDSVDIQDELLEFNKILLEAEKKENND